jgi:tetratricopeptide (TPR) repeat protein/DNA-binding CsgD family transcriptional regulator
MLVFTLLLMLSSAQRSYGKSSLDSLLTVVRKTSVVPMITALSSNAYEKRSDNPDEAIKLSLEAIKMSEKTEFVEGLIFNYRLLGNLYLQVYNYEEAINSYNQCIEYSLPRNDSVTVRECYLNKGVIYFTKGLNSKALEFYLLALTYSENLDKEKEYNNIGAVFFIEQEYEEAYNYYNKALELMMEKGDQYGISVTNNNIGDVFKMMQKYDVALIYYNKVLSVSDSLNNPELEIVCLNNIGIVKEMMNDNDSAIYYYGKGLEKAELLNDQILITRTMGLMGNIFFEKGLYAEAKSYLERAFNLSKDLVIYEDMSNTSKLLQLIYEKNGNFKEAYRYANMHILASDSLHSNEAKRQVLKLMFDHKINVQELERRQLLDTEQHERRKSTFKFYLIILILIIIVLLAILFLFRTMQQRKIERIKKEKADLQLVNVEKDVELRNREIIEKVLKISEKNELIDATVKLLDDFSPTLSQKQRSQLEAITRDLRMRGTKNQWEEFYGYFSQVYSQFYEKLEKEFPGLTLNEKRLCALLKLNMTTKDMAAITNLNFKSIEVARTRLRKKFNLTNSNLTLQEFFSQFN